METRYITVSGTEYKVDLWDRNTVADGISLTNHTLKPMCDILDALSKGAGGGGDTSKCKKLQLPNDWELGRHPITSMSQNRNGDLEIEYDDKNEVVYRSEIGELGGAEYWVGTNGASVQVPVNTATVIPFPTSFGSQGNFLSISANIGTLIQGVYLITCIIDILQAEASDTIDNIKFTTQIADEDIEYERDFTGPDTDNSRRHCLKLQFIRLVGQTPAEGSVVQSDKINFAITSPCVLTSAKIAKLSIVKLTSVTGADGKTPYIDPTEDHWFIDGRDTGVAASGMVGPQGDTGAAGADGKTPYIGDNNHWYIDQTDTGVSATGPKGDPCLSAWKPSVDSVGNLTWEMTESTSDPGQYPIPSGISLSAASNPISQERKTTVQIWEKGASTFDTSFDLPWGQDGTNGINGITPSGSYEAATEDGRDGTKVSFKYDTAGTDPRNFEFFVPNGQSTGATQIIGGQGIQADKASGEEKYTLTFSGGNFQNLSAASATRSEHTVYSEAAGGLLDEAHNNYRWAQQLISAYDEFDNNYKTYVTSAGNLLQTAGKYGLESDGQGNVSWGLISEGSTYNFDNNTQGYHTLSGDGATNPIGVNTDLFYKKTETSGASELNTEFGKYVQKSGDTMTGPLDVRYAEGKNILAVASGASLIGASRQTSGHFGQDQQAIGTTWLGVGQYGTGFIKYSNGGNVGDLNTSETQQINMKPNETGNGAIDITTVKNNTTIETRVINVPTSDYTKMVQSGIDQYNVSGPNYMLAKTENGFTIGAAVINCQGSLPGTLSANAYYFVY